MVSMDDRNAKGVTGTTFVPYDNGPHLQPKMGIVSREAAILASGSTRCRVQGDPRDPRTRCIFRADHPGDHGCPDWPERLADLPVFPPNRVIREGDIPGEPAFQWWKIAGVAAVWVGILAVMVLAMLR